jgi:hypothetical protein
MNPQEERGKQMRRAVRSPSARDEDGISAGNPECGPREGAPLPTGADPGLERRLQKIVRPWGSKRKIAALIAFLVGTVGVIAVYAAGKEMSLGETLLLLLLAPCIGVFCACMASAAGAAYDMVIETFRMFVKDPQEVDLDEWPESQERFNAKQHRQERRKAGRGTGIKRPRPSSDGEQSNSNGDNSHVQFRE